MVKASAPSAPSSNKEESNGSTLITISKLALALVLVISTARTYHKIEETNTKQPPKVQAARRRLDAVAQNVIPSFMNPLFDELKERKKLFEDTPEKEVKYWFEYTGALQKYYYRYSKSRGKADYFEGRDDSGVISARFVEEAGGGSDFQSFFSSKSEEDAVYQRRLLDNCQSMGAASRAMTAKGSIWYDWFGGDSEEGAVLERCRVLFVVNTVGAGKGTTILWETSPPLPHVSGPEPWRSEQESAAMHLERNLNEIDAMCASGLVAARAQILVCEPIPAVWTDWMDSKLVHCGGKAAPLEREYENPYEKGVEVEERASPVQVVVVASQETADSCHDLKSGFMEQRMQDLVLAPPYLGKEEVAEEFDPAVKTTHPDLVSSDDHDLYVAMKWSSLVTLRTLSAFLQSSADLAAAAQSPSKPLPDVPLSNLLIPSFVRVSYVSEENNKVAKWRMHGDFFHPAAWEISKESYNTTWIPHSISSTNGAASACTEGDQSCGQYWVFFQEEQMPTSPEIYANEASPPLIRGGSNFIWMLTERQRKEIVSMKVCQHKNPKKLGQCPSDPQAVLPLGDLESFLINFMPNTAIGKKHEDDKRPGYTHLDQMKRDRERVAERKQLKGQEDIEKALFDYTVYPAALFHKDATIKAARNRDAFLNSKQETGPQSIKSAYYDVTITKPRDPTLSWCQNIARRGLCALFSDYIRESKNDTCWEACGIKRDFTTLVKQE